MIPKCQYLFEVSFFIVSHALCFEWNALNATMASTSSTSTSRACQPRGGLGDLEAIQVEKPTTATMFSTMLIIPVQLQTPQSPS
jgi:hypothetical protein